jgi:hypothetical protein
VWGVYPTPPNYHRLRLPASMKLIACQNGHITSGRRIFVFARFVCLFVILNFILCIAESWLILFFACI